MHSSGKSERQEEQRRHLYVFQISSQAEEPVQQEEESTGYQIGEQDIDVTQDFILSAYLVYGACPQTNCTGSFNMNTTTTALRKQMILSTPHMVLRYGAGQV